VEKVPLFDNNHSLLLTFHKMTADPNEIYDQYLIPLITDILHLYASIYQKLRHQIKRPFQDMPESSATGGEVSSTTHSRGASGQRPGSSHNRDKKGGQINRPPFAN